MNKLLSFSTAAVLGLASMGSLSSCAELMKGIGEAAGNMMTEKTSSLGNAAVMASYVTNLFPRETQETGIQYLGESWQAGKNALQMIFFKHKGLGMYEIDGSISYRNVGSKEAPKPLNKVAFGSYAAILEANDTSPKEILVQTSSGQSLDFVMTPAPAIKIAKVNGQATAASVNNEKDLTLEISNPGNDPNSRLRVSFLSTVMGIKTFVDIGVFKPAAKLVIPAAAFRNLAVSSSAENFVGIDTGPSYLRVERYQVKGSESLKQRSVAAFQNLGVSWDTVPVTVTGNARDISKISLGNVHVPNAFYARPFPSAKTMSMASLQLEGSLFEQKTTTSESYGYGYKTITTTTITKQFPQLPDSHWDQLLQSLQTEVGNALKKQFNITLQPTEKVMLSKTYAELEEPPEENSYRFIKRSYKNSKYLMPRSIGGIVSSVSSTFASDRPMSRLMRDSGSDGLIAMRLNLQVAADKDDRIILIPSLEFQIFGPPNGYIVGPTTYASGLIQGQGVPFNSQELSNPASLNRIIQLKELVAGFQKTLAELDAKEKEAGYHAIWALQ